MNLTMTERGAAATQPLKDKVSLVTGSTSGEQSKHRADSHTLAADTGLSTHHRRVKSNAIKLCHVGIPDLGVFGA